MYNFQKDMVDTFHKNRFSICKLPRQSGKTTIIIAYILHYIVFNENGPPKLIAEIFYLHNVKYYDEN